MLIVMMTVFVKVTIVMAMLLLVIVNMTMMTMMTVLLSGMSYNLLRFRTPGPHKGTYVAASQQDDYHPARSHRDPTSFNHSTRHANHVVKQPLLDSL